MPVDRISLRQAREWTDNFSNLLGSGAYGEAFSGVSPSLGRVAVKRIKPEMLADVSMQKERDAVLEAFENERRVMERVNAHPNVAALYAYAAEGSDLALVYELANGGSLHTALHAAPAEGAAEKRLAWQQRLRVLEGAACGLKHLHSCGVFHRDVSSSNVGLDAGGAAKLLDCGLALMAPLPPQDAPEVSAFLNKTALAVIKLLGSAAVVIIMRRWQRVQSVRGIVYACGCLMVFCANRAFLASFEV